MSVRRRGLIGGAVLAVLWFSSGWAAYLLQFAGGRIATLGRLIPSPMRSGVFGSPVTWAVVVQLLTAIVLVVGFATIFSWLSRQAVTLASCWLAAVLTAFAIGAALDMGSFIASVGTLGIRGAAGLMGTSAPTVWWAVLMGWAPALVMMWAGDTPDPEAALVRRGTTASSVAAIVLAAIALVALPLATQAGRDAVQEQLRQDQAAAQAQADPEGAAAPDPAAEGEPVPPSVPAESARPGGACTSENTTILAPAPEAATGHRAQTLQLMNTSEEPCVVDGYPDIAYGDQNGHQLDVTIEHGGSFMSQDPGASTITLQPGELASAVVGWNANSVHGQLAARQLWVAVRAGEDRLFWDVSMDIIPGTTVYVTAWHVSLGADG